MYQRIEGGMWRHVWVVSDIHGCYQRLMDELKRRHFNPYEDLLISVGDRSIAVRTALNHYSLSMKNGFVPSGATMSKWRSTVWIITIFHSGQ